jgi:hypothetical protein
MKRRPYLRVLLPLVLVAAGVLAVYATLWAQDPPPPLPTVSFNPTSVDTNEKAGFVVLYVEVSKASTGTVTVNYATGSPQTATAGSDYVSNSGTLTFEAGVTVQAIVIEIIDDGTGEQSEYFTVTLSNATNATIGSGTCTVNIEDGAGSSPAFVAFEYTNWVVNETAGTVTITVKMTGSPTGNVSVDYKSWSDSATAGSDYTGVSGTLTWSKDDAGKTKSFTISITNDSTVEGTEWFFVVLTNPVNAALTYPAGAIVYITDDDKTCP